MLLRSWGAIDADTAVERAFGIFSQEHSTRTINFLDILREEGGASARLCESSKEGGVQPGIMIYPKVELCIIGGEHWFVGLGRRCQNSESGSRVIDLMTVCSDLSDQKINEKSPEAIKRISREIRRKNHNLNSSLVRVRKGGLLEVCSPRLKLFLNGDVERHTLFEDRGHGIVVCNGNSKSIVHPSVYDRRFPMTLAEKIWQSLQPA